MDPIYSAILGRLLGDISNEVGESVLSLTAAVRRQINCDITGEVMDIRRAVYLETDFGPAYVMSASAWDEHEKAFREGLAQLDQTITTVVDGRKLHEAGII